MITLIYRLVRWGITRNLLRTSFLLLTVIGLFASLTFTSAVMQDLTDQTIRSWRSCPFDIRATGALLGGLEERIAALKGVQQVERIMLLPLMHGAVQMEAAVLYQENGLLAFNLFEGRIPQAGDEIVLDRTVASDIRVGDLIQLAVVSRLEQPVSFTVCGISNNAMSYCLLNEAGARRAAPELGQYTTLLLLLDPAASSTAIEQTVKSMSTGVTTRNYDEAQQYLHARNTTDSIISAGRSALYVSGFGIFYLLMSLSQRERSRELGALNAIGFGKLRVTLFLLCEASALLVIGIVLAFAGLKALNTWFGLGAWQTTHSGSIEGALTVILLGLGANLLATFSVLRRPVARLIKG